MPIAALHIKRQNGTRLPQPPSSTHSEVLLHSLAFRHPVALSQLTRLAQGCCTSQPTPTAGEASSRSRSSTNDHHHPNSRRGSTTAASSSTHHQPLATTSQLPALKIKPLPPDTPIPRPPTTTHYTPGSRRPSLPPLTRAALAQARAAYFETAAYLGGRPEVWAALAAACEVFRSGDLAGAAAMLDAVGVVVPNGRLWGRGVWDSWGNGYEVPVWCLGDPEGVVEDDEEEEEVEEADAGGKEVGVERRDGDKKVAVRVRVSATGRDVIVRVDEHEHVAALVAKVRDAAKVS